MPYPALAAALTVGAVALAGCGGPSTIPVAAPRGDSPQCRQALSALPTTVLDQARTPTGTVGVAAWGEPPIVLRCGLADQPPTGKPCLTVDGVDWVVDDTDDPIVFTAYGRSPGLELRVPGHYPRNDAAGALVDLAAAARALPGTGHACVG